MMIEVTKGEVTRRAPPPSLGFVLVGVVLLSLLATAVHAGSGPAGHAPIGVMGDHTHKKGEVMLSYRYMRMGMNGMIDNDDSLSRSEVLQDFVVTPKSMDMEMHMVGAMYAPIERLTLMVMVPYVRLQMDHRRRDGVTFSTHSEGLGDIRVAGLIDLWENDHHKVHAILGLSFPSANFRKQDRLPAPVAQSVRLPYPMQLGTGTYDFLPGLTYNGHMKAWSWGGQARAEIRLKDNDANYRFGDEYALTVWGARELAKWVSASLRLEWQQNVNLSGQDDSISTPPIIVPTADPGRRAAMRLDALAGVNFIVPGTPLEGIRFAVEAGLPVYERVDGPALATEWLMTVGMQYAF